jgi:hypothetical protein
MKNPNAIINLGRDKIHRLQRPKVLHGTVTGKEGIYWTIRTDGPSHLRTMHFVRVQMNSADVGDRVTVVYLSTPSYGMWTVDTVLPLNPRWRDGFPLRDDPTSDI